VRIHVRHYLAVDISIQFAKPLYFRYLVVKYLKLSDTLSAPRVCVSQAIRFTMKSEPSCF